MPSLNRRGFFGLLGGAVAAITLDPEKALWVPEKKLISIPKPLVLDDVSVRFVRSYDPAGGQFISRMDVYWGFVPARVDYAEVVA